MNSQQAAVLCRYVRALCPQQKFDEYTPDAWHDVLRNYLLEEARTAAATIANKQPFVSPGEIATEIRRMHADRLGRHTDPTPRANPDDVAAYKAELAATRAAVATGQAPPSQAELAAGPMHPDVAARLKTLGEYVPRHVDEALDEYRPVKAARRAAIAEGQPDALSVPCGWCDAPVDEACRSRRIDPRGGAIKNRRRETPHPSRVEDARDAMQEQQ
jgi:hypothetical protein